MKFSVSNEAAKWFVDEFNLQPGAYIRIFTKIYGGIPTVYPKYYLGVAVEKSGIANFKVTVEDVTFYIDHNDDWILDAYDLNIELKDDDAAYIFTKATDR
ncbi:HesB/YadR/YfhF family protein [Loigolactobacillus zhaoyuanensis]|uniref:HesB/YadR/YfhF family protein n=1 Tax=Loigolactobacillus zhaoyuanensis TaxID=2486017 RepID=A0ABW8UC65_9LACO|nr:adhesin [Loigolactobacillus zhaoyuanensis]